RRRARQLGQSRHGVQRGTPSTRLRADVHLVPQATGWPRSAAREIRLGVGDKARRGMERAPSRLSRRLGLGDAVVIGLGSMIGAGVFAAIGPAARVAGSGLLFGIV